MEKLWRAFHRGLKAHEGQTRKSGEPYFTHALTVAEILTDLRLDVDTIAAGLLHDVVEDTIISLDDLRDEFGEEVALLVDGVTKISEIRYENPEAQQAENYRKFLLTISKDVRVILIKLADRLHNMRTIDALEPDRREAISQETLNVYAPLAHRFGIARMKWELEDLAFKTLYPEEFRTIDEGIAARREEREAIIQQIQEPLSSKLAEAGISAEIMGRPKHFYSIWKKMESRGAGLDQIYDLLAIRIIVESLRDCYHALGVIHSTFTPLHDRVKDYIANPKSNMYQSLHTTVRGPSGHLVEVQIRTREMHRRAEVGIAAHWRYKEGTKAATPDERLDQQLQWFREVLEWQRDVKDPREFMDALRIDLFEDDVYVFSPRGDLFKMPRGSTPLDYAFYVHSAVGLHCVGARVNARMVPLRYSLRSGETVEILTSKAANPSPDWLEIVKTSRAKHHIRHWIKARQLDEAIKLGRELLERELKKLRAKVDLDKELIEVAQSLGHRDADRLLAAIGSGHLPVQKIVHRLVPTEEPRKRRVALPPRLQSAFQRRSESAVRIQGISNLLIRFARCCQPVPGDAITGIISIGRGVSVHRADCANVRDGLVEAERRVEVTWDVADDTTFPVHLTVVGQDRKNLLADISRSIGELDCNIQAGSFEGTHDYARCSFMVEVRNLHHLDKIIKAIRKIPGVSRVERSTFVGGGTPLGDHLEGDD
jgi:guanosine-3',5'-bis(diphosphate) 3'-pyrophosphohydrolase